MLIVTIAGALGRDAEYKTTQGGKSFCSFPVAASVGYGDNKTTVWIDVTRWGEGAQGLTRLLNKGTKVTVMGELSTREHNGKTYLQCRADHVALQGGRGDGSQGAPVEPQRQSGGFAAGLDDDIPFLTANGVW
jgi:single-strand DNA-binding protein